MEPNFVLMKLPGEQATRVRRDPAVHTGQPEQPDRLDRRTQRRSELRQGARLRLPQDAAGGRSAADRGAHRSERAAVGTAVAVESAGLARPARHADRHSGRQGAAVRRADLPAGGAQPDAGTADRRARAAGSARVRTERSRPRSPRCSATQPRRSVRPQRPGAHPAARPSQPPPAGAPPVAGLQRAPATTATS